MQKLKTFLAAIGIVAIFLAGFNIGKATSANANTESPQNAAHGLFGILPETTHTETPENPTQNATTPEFGVEVIPIDPDDPLNSFRNYQTQKDNSTEQRVTSWAGLSDAQKAIIEDCPDCTHDGFHILCDKHLCFLEN